MSTPDPFIQSLTQKTSPVPYNQAIFLSQKTINNAFQNMWIISPPDSPIRKVDLQPRDGTSLQGVLNAPTVIVNVIDNLAELYFQWNFASGTMKLFESSDPTDPKMLSFDLTNWTIAYGTNLANEVIPKSDPSYNGYVAQMGAPPGSQFSISQLFLKAQENATYYAPGSNFHGTDWSKQTSFVQGEFASLRLMWSEQMEKANQTNLAVMLSTHYPDTVNPAAPTFPPTSIDFTVYPWRDPVNPMPANNDSESNALAYLIMTDNVAGPVPPAIPYTGCWVNADTTSDPNRDAILCFNSSQFWEKWLLPAVQIINRATQIQPITPELEPYGGQGGATIALNYTAGTCTAHPDYKDSYYQFVSAGVGSGWNWSAQSSLLATQNTMTSRNNNWTLRQNSTANTNLKFDSGAGTFTIVGNNSVSMNCDSHGEWSSNSSMSFTMSYTLQFVATRVDSGGLQILSIGSPQVNKGQVNFAHSSNVIWTPPLDEYGRGLQDSAFSQFQTQIASYKNALLTDLAGQHKLILPGSGDYLCNQVMFTQRGDFLVNLKFNGVHPAGEHNIPDFLVDAPPYQAPSKTPWVDVAPVPFTSLLSKSINISKPKSMSNGFRKY